MRFQTLPQWLDWQENLHFTEVDPGLERVGAVWENLAGSKKLPYTIVTVAGTNGKGSSVAILESILRAAGYRTGTYTSPHILRYNERICINNIPCDDKIICDAFNRIDHARNQVSLTYFEFATLAAVDIFQQHNIDIAILEVGMGGRLDAVNLFDTDIALITPISLDHTNWLGTTREKIGIEKAGVIRTNKPVVCSEQKPPQSVLTFAASLASPVYLAETDYFSTLNKDTWRWQNNHVCFDNLPMPALMGLYQIQNAAAVIQVILLLTDLDYSISTNNIKLGLRTVELSGRFQQIPGDVEQILDVTHNQQGAENLAKLLKDTPYKGRTIAVLGMLKDKDVIAVVSTLHTAIDQWYVGGLAGGRGLTGEQLAEKVISVVGEDHVKTFMATDDAHRHAMKDTKKGDRILVFGSFHTVESALRINNEQLSGDTNE
ncbi:MAG: bifunctional tetrahydrofolate synthase/dihydrofolate synthase [Methylophaga sp.]|nr:bifunctional tetrahydrofolate synthase/dihydrofolate synthase [Gammaproteobacteria bacterium]PHS69151.1 MAG: bifunctional tetrahydrofolate synthase/dihydrofolate synthase [Methylophaga sp.]